MSESSGTAASEPHDRTDPLGAVEDVVETVLYGAIGALVTTLEDWPRIVERGRREAQARIAPARVIGQLAVGHGHREAERVTRELLERFTQLSVAFLQGFSTDPDHEQVPDGESPAPASASPAADSADSAESTAAASVASTVPGATAPTAEPEVGDLAIQSYGTLSASQVTARLGGLTPEQRSAVMQYETAHRARASVLNAIKELDPELRPT